MVFQYTGIELYGEASPGREQAHREQPQNRRLVSPPTYYFGLVNSRQAALA